MGELERKLQALQGLVPHGNCMSLDGLFRRTADYIMCLRMQVKVMQVMVESTATDQIFRELQNNLGAWLQVVHILQNSQNLNTKFFALQAEMSAPSSFPVRHKSLSLDIKGNKTDIVLSSYDDHFLVIVTQIGSMGTILQARIDEGMTLSPTFNVSVIFGKRDEPMLVACAHQLIGHISSCGSSRPLVLSLGLKDHSAETLKGIVSAVIDNHLW